MWRWSRRESLRVWTSILYIVSTTVSHRPTLCHRHRSTAFAENMNSLHSNTEPLWLRSRCCDLVKRAWQRHDGQMSSSAVALNHVNMSICASIGCWTVPCDMRRMWASGGEVEWVDSREVLNHCVFRLISSSRRTLQTNQLPTVSRGGARKHTISSQFQQWCPCVCVSGTNGTSQDLWCSCDSCEPQEADRSLSVQLFKNTGTLSGGSHACEDTIYIYIFLNIFFVNPILCLPFVKAQFLCRFLQHAITHWAYKAQQWLRPLFDQLLFRKWISHSFTHFIDVS